MRAYYTLLRRITLFKEDWISPEHRRTAYALCRDIDETDTPHVALTLELDGVLWTGDNALKSGLKRKTNWRPEIIPGISGKWSVRGYKFPTSNLFILPVEEQGSYKKYSLYAIELLNDEWTSRCLLSGVMHYDEFRVSPDKRHIAAWTEHGWQCVTLDGELVGRWPTLEEWSLSPDSQWLAYSVSDNVDRSKRILTIRRIDGSDERKIYSYNYPDRHFFDKIYVGWVVSAVQ